MDNIDILKAYCVLHGLTFVEDPETNGPFAGEGEFEDIVAAAFAEPTQPICVVALHESGVFTVITGEDKMGDVEETYTTEEFLKACRVHV